MKSKTIEFLIGYIFLNILLFIPDYAVNFQESTFLPSSQLPLGQNLGALTKYLVRENYDIFRISGEFFIGVVLVIFLLRRFGYKKWLFRVFFTSYLLLFLYHGYYIVSIKLYQTHPFFLNDYVLVKEVLVVFLEQSLANAKQLYLYAIVGFIGAFALLYFSLKHFLKTIPQVVHWRFLVILLVGLGLFIMAITKKYHFNTIKHFPPDYIVVRWTTPKIIKSTRLDDANKFARLRKAETYAAYQQQTLRKRPNIYLLAIESYGHILTQHPEMRDSFAKIAARTTTDLKRDNWHIASALSDSPISGGRSWLSFTTVMTGSKIALHKHYKDLLEINPNYPHLVRFLNTQGYETFRMKTMSNQFASTPISYTLADQFFAFDRWIKFDDIPYDGIRTDISYGGIPDQYALNFFREEVEKDTTKPHFLFFITMSTHVPWFPNPPVVADWRTLNTMSNTTENPFTMSASETPQRYLASIDYEWKVLTKFIQEADSNDVFILFGDHQPPVIDSKTMATPVHIVSKDSTLVNGFKDYGFSEGIFIKNEEKILLKHEGLFSLMVRELLRNYGDSTLVLPEYLPDGI